ncbi:uncharacterized protein LOC120646393 [Panicum virgatum]|nr:uncharacterized protein LOC120646393 [Panicum virgatum]
MSVLHLPPASHNQRIVLTTTEDGGRLGFARMEEGYRLCLWDMVGTTTGWTKGRVIELKALLPVIDLLGFAHGLGVILVGTVDGFFSVDQQTGRINKVGDGPGFYNLVPYVSFCTPALERASKNEEPTTNA